MSRNEIRLRRHRLTATGADRFRNYGDVLERHQKDMRLRKLVKVFTLFFIILALVVLLLIIIGVEKDSASPAAAQVIKIIRTVT